MNATLMQTVFGGCGAGSAAGDLGIAILRVGIGVFIAYHGHGKVWNDEGFGPTTQFVEFVGTMGFPVPVLFAWMAALTEFVGGALIVLGLLTRPVALALAFNMAVAAFLAHRSAPLFATGQGASKEPALLYLLPFVFFVLAGAGRISVDHLILRTQRRSRQEP